jgi:crotonobetainyl-CoA:carnitine CoA-transferase CaiB-like acyl-CoA transferase
MSQEPLWTTRPIEGGGKPWPQQTGPSTDYKPLAGVKVIDFSRVIAAPAISKILALIRISHSKNPDYAATMVDLQTGKRDADLNLKTSEGKQAFTKLVKDADVLVDGFRPGAFERLGFTSESLREINPSLIYVRENCYGFKGPLSYRSGWQQVSDCLVGMAYLQGKFLGLEEAVLPLFRKSRK